jgi:hypothetical protein
LNLLKIHGGRLIPRDPDISEITDGVTGVSME